MQPKAATPGDHVAADVRGDELGARGTVWPVRNEFRYDQGLPGWRRPARAMRSKWWLLMIVWLVIFLIVIIVLVDSLRRVRGTSRRLTKDLKQLDFTRGRSAWLTRIRGARAKDDRL